ncbi:MAG: hypothetical protein IPM39_29405 [Chloroflexi bacterium]|nr:hypothetical protein [Chloroflexota bacterium]
MLSETSEINSVETIKIGGECFRLFTIRELFCYRHPTAGHVVKKSYAGQSIMVKGRVGKDPKGRAELIAAQKRKIERYNTEAVAVGRPAIVDYWWEAPGPTGRFAEDGTPL